MSLISTNGPVTTAQIADELVCSVSTARRHVSRLVARGWAMTYPGPRGTRLVNLTGTGKIAERDGERL